MVSGNQKKGVPRLSSGSSFRSEESGGTPASKCRGSVARAGPRAPPGAPRRAFANWHSRKLPGGF